jgi:hypothetical protein
VCYVCDGCGGASVNCAESRQCNQQHQVLDRWQKKMEMRQWWLGLEFELLACCPRHEFSIVGPNRYSVPTEKGLFFDKLKCQ